MSIPARIGVVLLLASGLAVAATADGGRARLDAFLSDMVSLRADFTQTVYDEDLQVIEASRGEVFLQRPGRFRWNYTEPYAQQIVADGRRVHIYDSELAQVTVKRQGQALGQTPALLLTSERPLDESFTVRDLGVRDDMQWVELRPKSADATFLRMRIGLGTDGLGAMELVDSFGQLTVLRFSDVTKNPRLDPALFTFDPPSGVDVIGGGDDEEGENR